MQPSCLSLVLSIFSLPCQLWCVITFEWVISLCWTFQDDFIPYTDHLRWVMSQPFGLIEWPFQNWGPISVKNAPMRADLEWFPKLDPKQSCRGWIMITKVYEPQPQVWVTVLHLYTMEDFFFQKLTLANLIQLWCPVKFPKHSWRRYWATKMTGFGPRFR